MRVSRLVVRIHLSCMTTQFAHLKRCLAKGGPFAALSLLHRHITTKSLTSHCQFAPTESKREIVSPSIVRRVIYKRYGTPISSLFRCSSVRTELLTCGTQPAHRTAVVKPADQGSRKRGAMRAFHSRSQARRINTGRVRFFVRSPASPSAGATRLGTGTSC